MEWPALEWPVLLAFVCIENEWGEWGDSCFGHMTLDK